MPQIIKINRIEVSQGVLNKVLGSIVECYEKKKDNIFHN